LKIDFNPVFNPIISTDESFDFFYKKTEKLLDEMAPMKKLSKKEIGLKQSPWITFGLLTSMKDRDYLYRMHINEKNRDEKARYHSLFKNKRNRIISLLRTSKKQYFAQFFEENQTNIKKTWEGIRNLLNVSKKSATLINKITENDVIFTDAKKISNKLNDFYVNMGNNIDKKIPNSQTNFMDYFGDENNLKIMLYECSELEVSKLINKFSTSKACGPFSIPSKILKEFDSFFIPPITAIINKSLKEGAFPTKLKLAMVIPIFKKGDKTKCPNYRPISLLSNISKIFERIMYNRIESFLNANSILYQHQYGFRKKYSTDHAILSIVEQIKTNLDNKTFSCGVFVDLEKAFDTVNHKILLSKLSHIGVDNLANKWLTSYLSNRSQCVAVNGAKSDYSKISCGVPQGSILGPLLFSIYINDMHKSVNKSTVFHFADDTNLLFSHKNPKELKKTMNKELKLLFEWLCANRLSLNVGKTEFIIFRPPKMSLKDRIVLTLNKSKIYESRKIKYLGLIIDDRLSWKFHINELCKKLNRSIGMLYKIRQYCPTTVLKSLYHSLFSSHLSYGLAVWGNADLIYLDKISKLQKRAVRAITFADYRASSLPILKKLEILSVKDLFEYKVSSLMWDFDHNTLPPSLATQFSRKNTLHSHQTRMATSGKLEIKSTYTKKYGTKAFKVYGAKMLNQLMNTEMYSGSRTKKMFQNKLRKHFLEKY